MKSIRLPAIVCFPQVHLGTIPPSRGPEFLAAGPPDTCYEFAKVTYATKQPILMNKQNNPANSDQNCSSAPPTSGQGQQGENTPLWLRIFPLVALLAAVGIAFTLDLDSYLNFETLRSHRNDLAVWVDNSRLLAPCVFLAIYVGVVLLSLPGPMFVTLAGGFLFGALPGVALSLSGATIGATIVLLVVRTALGSFLQQRGGNFVKRMEYGFKKNAFNYLLAMRLIPLFPFGMVTLSAAILGVRVKTFIAATLLGSFPATLILSLAGAGLDDVFKTDEGFSLTNIFSPQLIIALIGLVALALSPICYQFFLRKNGKR